jgi:hypothetical protein
MAHPLQRRQRPHASASSVLVERPGWFPIVAAYSKGPRGILALAKSGIKLSRCGVLVTHFEPDPCSDKTLLRI